MIIIIFKKKSTFNSIIIYYNYIIIFIINIIDWLIYKRTNFMLKFNRIMHSRNWKKIYKKKKKIKKIK